MDDRLRPYLPVGIPVLGGERPGPTEEDREEPASSAAGRAICLASIRMQHEHDIETERRIGMILDVTVQSFCAAWVVAHLIAVASLLLEAANK